MIQPLQTDAAATSRIVIATFGSLGDLHPYLALATELRHRGHQILVATAEFYRDRIESLGFDFAPLGPPLSPEDPTLLRRLMGSARGPEYLFRELFLPHLERIYNELAAACIGADLLIASEVVFVAPILADKTGIPWVSVLLSPIAFFSPHDPSVLPRLEWFAHFRGLPLWIHRALLRLPAIAMRRWSAPLNAFRTQLGLPPDPDALLRSKMRAPLVLALFSRHFAGPQPDWPAHVVQTGFTFFDQSTQEPSEAKLASDARLEAFLQAGDPPVVVTLGSAAVHAAGDFFYVAARTAERIGIRAVFLGGSADLRELQSARAIAVPYADHSRLFPRAGAIIHQGGIGTTAEALRAGVPSVIVPFSFDQPDNAARATRLGVALTMPRRKWNRRRSYYALHRLLRGGDFRERAGHLAAKIRAEDGTATAVNAIEQLLHRNGPSS